MPGHNPKSSGWRGVGLVAITYVYFLIFAQFAFLKRLATLGIADSHLKVVMGAMAAGGMLLSLLTPRVMSLPSPALRLRAALAICGSAALLSLCPLSLAASVVVAFLIGSGLGILTVTLVTYLPLWLGEGNSLLKVGLGTGIGYFLCNVPQFFTAAPAVQAAASAILCLAGIFCATPGESVEPRGSSISFLRVVACFTALVWLDSAAFFIIQNTPALKAGTWQGTAHLWANGGLHLAAALASGWFLRRRGLLTLLALAFFALASACLLLLDPNRAVLASLFYPVGVSLYSVALVAYPSLLAPAASAAERGRRAGWIYAIAGWFGSAMGIGMGQNLGRIPPLFVLLAGVLILAPPILSGIRRRRLEIAATLAILGAAFFIDRAGSPVEASGDGLSPAERGRRIYISEGCISCHSQYVRPNTPDVTLWGPVESLDELRRAKPPLIGNRRQGPDLARIGNRRSPLWLKAHFYNPPELSHASIMPSYAYLFQDRRGDDLVAYLASRQGDVDQRRALEQSWRPSPSEAPNLNDGERLFDVHCSTCHDPRGRTRNAWQASFRKLPPNLLTGPSTDGLARIVKFGLPGTDMPGHEYLTDNQIASIAFWLIQIKSTGEKL